jgi:hypothetical protein
METGIFEDLFLSDKKIFEVSELNGYYYVDCAMNATAPEIRFQISGVNFSLTCEYLHMD